VVAQVLVPERAEVRSVVRDYGDVVGGGEFVVADGEEFGADEGDVGWVGGEA